MITMFDSIDPGQLPAGPGYAYAGYVNGRWPDFQAIKAKFPGHDVLSITITAAGDADCLDVEPGDATPAEAGQWVLRQLTRGVNRPCVYSSVSQMGAVLNAVQAVSAQARLAVRIWTAHYGGGRHICGPATCKLLTVPADGTQWTSNSMGRNLDESVMLDDFFSGAGGVTAGSGIPDWEAAIMNSLPVLKSGAKGDAVRRVQGLCLAALPGSKLAIDGAFGPATEAAVKQIQSSHHIAADGIVGPQTWAVLITGSA